MSRKRVNQENRLPVIAQAWLSGRLLTMAPTLTSLLCSWSLRTTLPRSVLSSTATASSQPQWSCAAGSPALGTTPKLGNAPAPSPAGRRRLTCRLRWRGCAKKSEPSRQQLRSPRTAPAPTRPRATSPASAGPSWASTTTSAASTCWPTPSRWRGGRMGGGCRTGRCTRLPRLRHWRTRCPGSGRDIGSGDEIAGREGKVKAVLIRLAFRSSEIVIDHREMSVHHLALS